MHQDSAIYDLFLCQAKLSPNKIAITDAEKNNTSYAELVFKIDAFAEALLRKKLNKNDIVAVALTPSSQFLIAMFACLKLGIPYIPLNVTYPRSYIDQILKDARITALISKANLIESRGDFDFIDVDEVPPVLQKVVTVQETVSPKNMAYIIYTSGSTGLPKGVIMTHENLVSLIDAAQPLYKVNENDVAVLFHSVGFDLSIWEICFTLINGAKLIIVPEKIKQSVEDYCRFLIEQEASILTVTPSMWYLLQDILIKKYADEVDKVKLRCVISAGEALHPMKMKKWFACPLAEHVGIYNMYGITEGTIHSTYRKILKEDTLQNTSPIGIPLSNVEIAVVDEHNELVKDNDVGELCLSGLAVTNGYLNHPELNAESFFTKSFYGKKSRYFKTKDLVKKLSNGELEYIERKNNVVKIKGFRVDFSEIENHLIRYDFVVNAVVSTFLGSDNVKRLVAYLQGSWNFIDLAAIKKDLQEKLPGFMCPSKFIVVEKFPLTINGKIDLNKLSELQQYQPTISDESNQEVGTEELIKKAWQQVLGKEDIGLEENFFDVGGDSLLLPKLLFLLQESLNREFELIDLVEYSSIKQFAKFISDTSSLNIEG